MTGLATAGRSPPRRQPKNALQYDQLVILRVFSRPPTFCSPPLPPGDRIRAPAAPLRPDRNLKRNAHGSAQQRTAAAGRRWPSSASAPTRSAVRFTAAEARALRRRAAERGCAVAVLVREDLARRPDAVHTAEPTASDEAVAPPRGAAPRRPVRSMTLPAPCTPRAGIPLRKRSTRCAAPLMPSCNNSGGGRDRSHHRVRPRDRRHGRLHHPQRLSAWRGPPAWASPPRVPS